MAQDKVIENLLLDLTKKANEIKEIHETLEKLKKYGAEIEVPDLNELLKTKNASLPSTNISIRSDEFFGLSNNDAVEKYLKKIGHAMTLQDIYNALTQGGIIFKGEGTKSLYVQVVRATSKFVKIGKGRSVSFGLKEWYPGREKTKRVRFEENRQTELEEIKDKEETTK